MTEVPDAPGRARDHGDGPATDPAGGGGPVVDMVVLEDVRGVESAVVVVDGSGDAEVVVLDGSDPSGGGPSGSDPSGSDPSGSGPSGSGPQSDDHAGGGDHAPEHVTTAVSSAEDDEDEDADDADDDDPSDGSADPLAALGALFGGGSGSNPLAGLLAQAQQLQEGMVDAQRRLGEQRVSGTSGGGLVRATVTGTGELVALRLDPSVVDPTDVETLADLVIAAVRAATADARALGERAASSAMPAFGGAGGGPSGGPGFADFGQLPDFGQLAGFGQLPHVGQLPDPGRLPDPDLGTVAGVGTPDLRRIPGAGPLAAPAGDDAEDDDLGPAGRPAGV